MNVSNLYLFVSTCFCLQLLRNRSGVTLQLYYSEDENSWRHKEELFEIFEIVDCVDHVVCVLWRMQDLNWDASSVSARKKEMLLVSLISESYVCSSFFGFHLVDEIISVWGWKEEHVLTTEGESLLEMSFKIKHLYCTKCSSRLWRQQVFWRNMSCS